MTSFLAPGLAEQQESMNQSLMEEEWRKRTSVVFDLDDEDPQVVSKTKYPHQ